MPNYLLAEYHCIAEVSYKVKKSDQELDVHWLSANSVGSDENEAKSKLDIIAAQEQKKALEGCRKNYENLSGCVASRFASVSRTYNQMSFNARKNMEEAISNDCKTAQGECLGASTTKITCKLIEDAKAAEGNEKSGEDEGAKAGSKEKDKKKK